MQSTHAVRKALLVAGLCAVAACAGHPAVQLDPVQLPLDEAAHADPLEWWYYTGHLVSTDAPARHYGFEVTVFQLGQLVGGHGRMQLGHFALIDLADQSYHPHEMLGPILPHHDGPASGFDFDFHHGAWKVEGSEGKDHVAVSAGDQAVDLHLEADKPAALLGDHGIVDYGGVVDLAYYSRTRMEVTGTVRDGDAPHPVRGMAWMDHQWGSADMKDFQWKWFSAQLDDGREVILFQVWRRKPHEMIRTYAALVDSAGHLADLPVQGLRIDEQDPWSAGRHASYPTSWGVDVPDAGLQLQFHAQLPQQRFKTRGLVQLGPVYWEGSCTVLLKQADQEVPGVGFVEYAGFE